MTAPHAFPLEPTPIHVPDEVLDDLRARLALTRPPLDEGNGDWSYGVPDSYLRELVAYWREGAHPDDRDPGIREVRRRGLRHRRDRLQPARPQIR
ncbi:epoxide hydrolase N-terminal domain-containing protein [Streptomyces sp. NBC_00046]|uniref:epoxide hydrolase N-terminal domain-containing protein n=1 Tax=unclassified Streptomyces TaxID=2593676 RepID=UPI00324D5E20